MNKGHWVALISGFIFAIGLGVSGMTQPQKVIGFLDFFGQWDPSLAMVMLGAILTHSVSYRWIRRRPSPILDEKFHVPTSKDIDWRLLLGASLFGIGWGLSGFCPGPALTSLASGNESSYIFVVFMLLGMAFFRLIRPLLK